MDAFAVCWEIKELITKMKIKDTELRELITSFLYKKGLKMTGLAKTKGGELYKLICELYKKYNIENINDTLTREINELRQLKKEQLKQKKIEKKEQEIRYKKAMEQHKKLREEEEKEIEEKWNNGVMDKLIELYKREYTHRINQFKIIETELYTEQNEEYWEQVKQENKKRQDISKKWKKEIEDKFNHLMNEKLGDYMKIIDNETIEMRVKGTITQFTNYDDTRTDIEKSETLAEAITAITSVYGTILEREYILIEGYKKREENIDYQRGFDYSRGFYTTKLKPLLQQI
jgi:hypothetical protein